MKESLPLKKQIAYAIGQLGWSTLINIVSLQLVYFYRPPDDSGIPLFITQVVFLAVLNVITLVAAAGRLWDAITDPFIASLSDRWPGAKGRRIPFLRFGAFPAAFFTVLMFVPIIPTVSGWNIAWLFLIQTLFYIFLTVYVTPYFALLPEMGHSATERLNLSTWISITYALGIMVASQVPLLANMVRGFGVPDKVTSIQVAIGLLSLLAMVFMLVPTFVLDERRYSEGKPSNTPLSKAMKRTFKNKNFIYYVTADFSYFMGITIIMTGLLYYITVLLGLEESLMGQLLPMMVIISFVFYPLVNFLAKKVGKKVLISGSFLFMSIIFFSVFFLGRFPIADSTQAYLLVIFYAIPISFLGILPNAVLADIAEHDALTSGIRQEGMFFAARTLMQKFGQTFGVLVFAALTSLGKDPGDDLGVRVSGLVGFALCFFAGTFFLKYNEKKVIHQTESLQSQAKSTD